MTRRSTMLLVLGVVAALLAWPVWLVSTQSGLAQLATLVQLASGNRLVLTGLSGTALGPLSIDAFTVTTNKVHITIRGITLAWSPAALLRGEFHATALNATELTITPQPGPASDTAPTLPDIRLPLRVRVDQAALTQLVLNRTDGSAAPFTLRGLELSGAWNDDGLQLDHAQIRYGNDALLTVRGHVQPQQAYPMDVHVEWRWPLPQAGMLVGSGTFQGDLARLTVTQQVTEPAAAQLTAQLDDALHNLTWQAQLTAPKSSLQQWSTQAPAINAAATVDLSGDRHHVKLNGQFNLQRDQYDVRSELRAYWQDQRVTVERSNLHWPGLDQPFIIAGHVDTTAPYAADATLTWTNVSGKASESWRFTRHTGTLAVNGTLDRYTGHLKANGALNDEKLTLDLAAHGDRTSARLEKAHIALGPRTLQGDGNVSWTPELNYDAYLNWKKLGWPLQAPSYESDAGTVHLAGDRRHAVVGGQLALNGPYLPRGDWQVGGIATPENIHIAYLEGRTQGGHATAQGDITLRPALRIRADINGDHIDLAQWLKQMPSQLNVRGSIDGTLGATIPQTWQFDVEHVDGTVRGLSTQARGHVTLQQRQWTLDPVLVQIGKAHAVAQGRIGTDSDLAWSAIVPDLERIDAQWRGQLDTQGSFTGNIDRPALRGWLRGAHIRIAGWSAQQLDAEADVDFQPDSTRNSTLQVRVKGIAGGAFQLDELNAGLSGTRRDHALAFRVASPDGSLTAAATGTFDHATWNGTISDARLITNEFGTWSSTAPGHLAWTPEELTLATWCVSGDDGQVCVSASRATTGAWQTRINAPHLALELLQPWMPGTVQIKGNISAAAALQQDPGQRPTGTIVLVANDGKIRLDLPNQGATTLSYKDAMLSAKLLAEEITLNASGSVVDTGEASATLRFPPMPWSTPWQDTPITAHGTLSLRQFRWISALEPAIEQPHGVLTMDMSAAGTLGEPTLSGTATLDDASLRIAGAGTRITRLSAHVEATGEQNATFRAEGRVGDGSLALTGEVSWADNVQRVVANIRGERMRVVDTPDMQVDVSPDVQIALTPELATVNGVVAIPHANVLVKAATRTIKPSPDVVIVDAPPAQRKAIQTLLSSIVRIELGDDVKFEGFGLRARLEGNVAVLDTPDRLTSAIGEVRIVTGQYEPPLIKNLISGPKLSVNNGRMVFVGGPIDDPALNLRANRKIGEVEAGFNVTGTLQEPQVGVYSIPGMSDTDALSYILLGRPTQKNSSEENNLIDSTTASLTVAGGEFLADTLRRPLGIEEVTVEQDFAGNTSLQLGRYLSPKLFVSYGVGLTERINTLRMRYELTSNWSIEAETAATFSAADILYTLEKD